jgi:hypothetical protein
MPKKKKARAVKYELIPHELGPWRMLEKMLPNHPHLTECRIALLWRIDLKPDVDGKLVLGKSQKISDCDKELAEFDWKILLNQEAYLAFSDEQRAALVDHELSHIQVKRDAETGDPARDERGRVIYRNRKHDIEEFASIVERHGLYKCDLEAFAETVKKARKPVPPLFADQAAREDAEANGQAANGATRPKVACRQRPTKRT